MAAVNRRVWLMLCTLASLAALSGCSDGRTEEPSQPYGGLVVVLNERAVTPTGTLSYRIENQTDRQWSLTQMPAFARRESSGAWMSLPRLGAGTVGGAGGGSFTVDSGQATDWIDVPLEPYGLETGRHRIRLAVREPVRNVILELFAEFTIEA